MNIILIIIVTIALLGLLLLIMKIEKQEAKSYYVYKHNVYKVVKKVKMRLPVQGTWIEAYLYYSLDTHHFFVREVKDFDNKFITLKQYQYVSR